jgi:hypothetical protein
MLQLHCLSRKLPALQISRWRRLIYRAGLQIGSKPAVSGAIVQGEQKLQVQLGFRRGCSSVLETLITCRIFIPTALPHSYRIAAGEAEV